MNWLVCAYLDYETVGHLRIRDCYDWHQRAWDFFPGRPKGYPRPFLFRVIEKNQGCDFWLMCREEPTKPDWVENVNWKMNVVKAGFPFHRYYRFDILANPTQRDKRRDGWNGREPKRRRFTLTEINEQREWFLSKAEEHGFRLLEDSGGQLILDTDPRKDYAFLYRDNSHGLHIGVRYQGALEVTEPKQFREAFTDGIGSAKSFGFGLLLLAPLTLHNQNTGGGIL